MDQAALISKIVTTSAGNYITQSKDHTKIINGTQTLEDTEELRAAYEKIIVTETWNQQFVNAADIIIENLKKDKELIPITNTSFSISQEGHMYEFNNEKYILIGRKPGCHVQFIDFVNNGTSRMHAMVFPLPELNMIIVVDMGSFNGILTLKRSSNKQCVSSFPNSRNVLIFDWNEVAILKMGNLQIGLNTKECVICMTNPRNVTFGCGHNATCDDCSQKIVDCPICRKNIIDKNRGFALATNINY